MKLPSDVRKRFQAYGKTGGRARAARLPAAARRSIARHAALRRWTRERFGDSSFAALGLPGGEILDAGLDALAAERETAESLLVSLAAPRLRREGVPVPSPLLPDPDRRLYRLLEQSSGELAHARYLACLAQAASFADACGRLRRKEARRRAQ
jgi:hypothetical protein